MLILLSPMKLEVVAASLLVETGYKFLVNLSPSQVFSALMTVELLLLTKTYCILGRPTPVLRMG